MATGRRPGALFNKGTTSLSQTLRQRIAGIELSKAATRTAREGRQAIKELMRAAVSSLPEIGHSAANIGRTAAEFARRSRAPATESAYASDWADFTAWCDSATTARDRLPVAVSFSPPISAARRSGVAYWP
jgi:hypothetical protein